MSVGPRLDTPSAIGDEGRPRETSLTVAAVVVVGLGAALGFALGQPRFFGGFAFLASLAVAGVAFLDRDRLRPTVVGHLLFLPASCALLVVVSFSPTSFVLVIGFVAAMVGMATAWTDVLDRETLSETLASSLLAYVFGVLGLVVVALVWAVVWLVVELAGSVARATDPATALLGLVVVGGIVCACLAAAVHAVPAVQLSPVRRREAVERRVDRLRRRLLFATGGAFVAAMFGAVFLAAGVLRPLVSVPPFPTLLGVLTSRLVLYPLLAVAGVALLVAVVAGLARKATADYDAATTRTVGAGIAAGGYLVMIGLLAATAGFLPASAALFVSVGVLVPIGVYVVLGALLAGMAAGVVPDRAGPAALTAAGLVVAAIGAAAADLPPIVVFATVAGALIAWDVGTFGLGLTAELGHVPETRRLELYHAVFAVGVGLVALLLVSGLEVLRHSVALGFGATVAMAVAAVGVVLLVIPLRG